jgi:GrpB-like predicted nucleotidyltransferase (UPF0157 family)
MSTRIDIVSYDSRWPELFRCESRRLRAALGDRALQLEHVGSTSVPDLAAKPVIDILLVVANSADETSYLPRLEAAGYSLRFREPGWYEHRLLRGANTEINLHVLSAGCPEIARMLAFRDWLRSNPGDRELYQRTKLELAEIEWKSVDDYANAKSVIVAEIMLRAQAGSKSAQA